MTSGERSGSPIRFEQEYQVASDLLRDIHASAAEEHYGTFESSIVKQIFVPNPDYVPNGRFFDRIGALATSRTMPNTEEFFELGMDIAESIQERKDTPRGLMLGFLNACAGMDLAKTAFVGNKSTTKLTHAIQTYTRKQLVEWLPLDAKTENLFIVITQALLQAYELETTNDSVLNWMVTKHHTFYNDYRKLKRFSEDVSGYYQTATQDVSAEQLRQIDGDIRLLNEQSMAHRKYGTKPAYTEASIGGSWIFYDGEEYRQSILQKTRNTILPRVAAVVHHSPLTDLKNIQINIETIDMGSSADLKVLGGGLAEAKPDFAVIINLDGSMTIDYEGLQPVDYALSGNPLAARMLKAEIAANFYDLSMPVDDSSPSTLRNYAGMSPAERQDFEPLLTLLVPRIRRLNDPRPDIVESGRTVREHDVTWFVRSLRPGWHASPVAIENARRVGIKLEPNETFVKAHKRGLGNTVLGYHAVKRSVDLAPGEDY